jgi:hypothetical protein
MNKDREKEKANDETERMAGTPTLPTNREGSGTHFKTFGKAATADRCRAAELRRIRGGRLGRRWTWRRATSKTR